MRKQARHETAAKLGGSAAAQRNACPAPTAAPLLHNPSPLPPRLTSMSSSAPKVVAGVTVATEATATPACRAGNVRARSAGVHGWVATDECSLHAAGQQPACHKTTGNQAPRRDQQLSSMPCCAHRCPLPFPPLPHLGRLVLQGGLEQGGKGLGAVQATQVGGRQVAHLANEQNGEEGRRGSQQQCERRASGQTAAAASRWLK